MESPSKNKKGRSGKKSKKMSDSKEETLDNASQADSKMEQE